MAFGFEEEEEEEEEAITKPEVEGVSTSATGGSSLEVADLAELLLLRLLFLLFKYALLDPPLFPLLLLLAGGPRKPNRFD